MTDFTPTGVVPYRVVWKRVAVRQAPSTKAAIVGACSKGEIVMTCGTRGNWAKLAPASTPKAAQPAGHAYMMIDGTEVGCGILLEPQVEVPLPAVDFAAARAVIFSWDEWLGAATGGRPVHLEVRQHDSAGNECFTRFCAEQPAESGCKSLRIGGIRPGGSVAARCYVDVGDGTASSCWKTVRTR